MAWGDLRYAHWGMRDEAFTEWQLERLEAQLRALSACAEVRVVTHHVASKRLLVHPRAMVPHHWRFLNAFLGTTALEALIGRFPNVTEVVNGHIHRSGEVRIGGARYASLACGKGTRQLLTIDGGVLRRREALG